MNNDRLEPGERCASTSNRNLKAAKAVGAHTFGQPSHGRRCRRQWSFADVRELSATTH